MRDAAVSAGPEDAAAADAATLDAQTARDAGATTGPIVTDDAGLPTTPISDLTYLGTDGNSDVCSKSFRTSGFAPVSADAKHPLFLYFVGTAGGDADLSARYDGRAGAHVTEAMARRGFVALSVEYDNALFSILANKQPCLFDLTKADSLLSKACALPSVDCALGIATWGHSQGALLAHAAANFDPRVRAVWTTGYSGLTGAKLDYHRFRTVNGEADTGNSAVATANKTAGFGSGDACPDDGRDSCLRSDGSGWIVVRKTQCQLTAADHCWFNKKSCADNAETLEPNWSTPSSQAAFAIEWNADWVAQTVARP